MGWKFIVITMFFKNDYKLGVMNGQSGRVTKIEEGQLVVESNNSSVKINTAEYNHFDYGYVMTTHKAQGVTVDRSIINIDSTQKQLNKRNQYYVDISRAKNAVSIYVNDKNKIVKQICDFNKGITAINFKKEAFIKRTVNIRPFLKMKKNGKIILNKLSNEIELRV